MPTLNFKQPYKSISQFEATSISDLTIITGLNGCGKTHLLQAITQGHCSIDDIPVHEIKYFEPKTFSLVNESAYTNQQIDQERIQA